MNISMIRMQRKRTFGYLLKIIPWPTVSVQSAMISKTLKKALRLSLQPLWQATRVPLDFDNSRNWGDKLSPFLVSKITGKKCYKPIASSEFRYFVIGSILSRADASSYIWGAGFISQDSLPIGVPCRIDAVRGPLTRSIFLNQGIDCPQVYGDPPILVSSLFQIKRSITYRYGLIPHYVVKQVSWVEEQCQSFGDEVLLIDIEAGVEEVMAQVASCEFIYSSSLHGLICADSFGIKNVRISLSDKIIGGDFKFHDYRLGVGSAPHLAINPITDKMNLKDLKNYASVADISKPASQQLV